MGIDDLGGIASIIDPREAGVKGGKSGGYISVVERILCSFVP
jgi:hypothetical protein